MSKAVHINVIYEDNHLIAVNKPAGVLVHADKTGDECLEEAIKQYIKHKYDKPGDVFLGVIHRLDRPVSGVVVFARTSKALSRMNKLFQDRKVDKQYIAIVNHIPHDLEGTLTHYLKKDTNRNIARAYHKEVKGGKKSTLDYEYKSGLNGYHLLEVRPHTGRPHQIRVQLSSMGTPIVGDLKYGYNTPTQDASICLHCSSLKFIHPVKKEPLTLSAPMPKKQYWNIFR